MWDPNNERSQCRKFAIVLHCRRNEWASVLNDTWNGCIAPEEARKAAEQLTDPDAKQCMLQAGPILRWDRTSCPCTGRAAGR